MTKVSIPLESSLNGLHFESKIRFIGSSMKKLWPVKCG